MTTTSDVHNSRTCSRNTGGPCGFCAAANDYEQRQQTQLSEAEFIALAGPVLERVREELNEGEKLTELRKVEPEHLRRILHALDNDRRFASLTTIRAALFDVFDQNVRELSANDCDKHQTTDEEACENRCDFVDAVCQRIAQLQSTPHNFDPQYHDYCTGYATGWADAHTETLRLQNEDLREMLRVGNERIKR